MIIFYSQGQLGNQLFHYHFLSKYARVNETVLVSGMDELVSSFDLKFKIRNFKKQYLQRLAFFVFYKVCKILAKKGVFNFIYSKKEQIVPSFIKESVDIVNVIGFFNRITVLEMGNYNSDFYFNHKLLKIAFLKETFKCNALKYFNSIKADKKIFIHIRKGDYSNFSVFGCSVELPLEYYYRGIELINERFKNDKVCFIFCTNDSNFVEEHFKKITNKVISKNAAAVDLGIMNLCDGGILSASTFSYWGAFWQTHEINNLIIAPKNWFGFRSGVEYPIKGTPKFAKTIDVLKLE